MDFGPLKTIEVKKEKSVWSEYLLADGTKLRVRPIVIEVKRSKKYNSQGDPIYVAANSMVIQTLVPKKLKKKLKKPKRRGA